MMSVYLQAQGLAAPGLPNWAEARPVLRGECAYRPEELPRYKPQRLPPNERRRATRLVRTAFRVCEELAEATPADLSQCAAVFASGGGDYTIIDQICRVLRSGERHVSPTQFHNSVHNSAAGYWSIATGSRAASTSISGFDDTFAAGLLEAATFCAVEGETTLLAAYDIQPPEPLWHKRPLGADFGLAWLLTPEPDAHSIAQLTLSHPPGGGTATACEDAGLETLRLANPAARSLPLLTHLARGTAGQVHLSAPDRRGLRVEISPC